MASLFKAKISFSETNEKRGAILISRILGSQSELSKMVSGRFGKYYVDVSSYRSQSELAKMASVAFVNTTYMLQVTEANQTFRKWIAVPW